MKSAFLITYDDKDSINEALALADAANYRISQIIKQSFLNKKKFGISEFNAEEIL